MRFATVDKGSRSVLNYLALKTNGEKEGGKSVGPETSIEPPAPQANRGQKYCRKDNTGFKRVPSHFWYGRNLSNRRIAATNTTPAAAAYFNLSDFNICSNAGRNSSKSFSGAAKTR
jgi:hypothetical protein